MASSSQNRLFCQIRKDWVKHTAEESVRQNTLSFLISIGYPASLILVERKISELPHFSGKKRAVPNRRVDIVCYAAGSLVPLLLIECKAKKFSTKETLQLLGYNFYISAKRVLLIAQDRVQMMDGQGLILPNQTIPPYQELAYEALTAKKIT